MPVAYGRLAVIRDGKEVGECLISKRLIEMGTKKGSAVQILRPNVEPVHCKILIAQLDNEPWITNCCFNLEHMTLLNGKKVKEPIKLKTGDEIIVGGRCFRFFRYLDVLENEKHVTTPRKNSSDNCKLVPFTNPPKPNPEIPKLETKVESKVVSKTEPKTKGKLTKPIVQPNQTQDDSKPIADVTKVEQTQIDMEESSESSSIEFKQEKSSESSESSVEFQKNSSEEETSSEVEETSSEVED